MHRVSADNSAVQHSDDGQADQRQCQRWPAEGEQNPEKLDRKGDGQKQAKLCCAACPLHQQHRSEVNILEIVEVLNQSFHYRTIVRVGPAGFDSSVELSASCMALEFDCFACAIAR
jgi:hypothetical protein